MSRSAIETARAQVAELVNSSPGSVISTEIEHRVCCNLDNLSLNAVRVSVGKTNTLQEVESLVTKLQELVNNLPAVMRQAAV